MCVDGGVCLHTARTKDKICTSDLHIHTFSSKLLHLLFMYLFIYFILSWLYNRLHCLYRHQRLEKAFLLAVDLEARDLFMVSGK